MAVKKKSVLSKKSFTELLLEIGYRFSLPKAFDDFLTMSIAACTQNPETKLSWYEDEYLQTISYYKDSELRYNFSKAFAALVMEMEEQISSSLGNDVLGTFYELHITKGKKGQFFTPFPICQFMASITNENTASASDEKDKPIRILDPACGSGRMLLASHKVNKSNHEYYGIDIDLTCVKMTALNLFLNGMWNSEVMCANALMRDDFVIAYKISFLPLGIFKITEKEKLRLWWLHKNSVETKAVKETKGKEENNIVFTEIQNDLGTQLNLF